MNDRLLKPLKETMPTLIPKVGNSRFEAANLPATDLHPAVLHLKLANPEVSDNLDKLRDTLKKHNDDVDMTEKYIASKLVGAFTEHKLVLLTEWGNRIQHILSQIWRIVYINKLYEHHGFLYDTHKELLEELDSCKRPDQGSKMLLGYGSTDSLVFEEKQVGEKAKAMEAIKAVLNDTTILEKLTQIEHSKRKLESDINEIVQYASTLSDDIDLLAYEGRAKCCYANIPWFIRLFV